MPRPSPHVQERGSSVLSVVTVPQPKGSNQIAEHVITCNNVLARDLVCLQYMGNAIITFFMPFDPVPCDKKSRPEHQTLFLLFGDEVWARDNCRSVMTHVSLIPSLGRHYQNINSSFVIDR